MLQNILLLRNQHTPARLEEIKLQFK